MENVAPVNLGFPDLIFKVQLKIDLHYSVLFTRYNLQYTLEIYLFIEWLSIQK